MSSQARPARSIQGSVRSIQAYGGETAITDPNARMTHVGRRWSIEGPHPRYATGWCYNFNRGGSGIGGNIGSVLGPSNMQVPGAIYLGGNHAEGMSAGLTVDPSLVIGSICAESFNAPDKWVIREFAMGCILAWEQWPSLGKPDLIRVHFPFSVSKSKIPPICISWPELTGGDFVRLTIGGAPGVPAYETAGFSKILNGNYIEIDCDSQLDRDTTWVPGGGSTNFDSAILEIEPPELMDFGEVGGASGSDWTAVPAENKVFCHAFFDSAMDIPIDQIWAPGVGVPRYRCKIPSIGNGPTNGQAIGWEDLIEYVYV